MVNIQHLVSLIFVSFVLLTKADHPDWDAVKVDILELFTNSSEIWTADEGHFGPFFIRLAWHCTGTYRTSDGRGGCEGGRIRFPQEASWGSNANLDKALEMLEPIKGKYHVSWSDLIVFVGNTAIEDMGGPAIPFCGGRIDDMDGSASDELTEDQIYIPADSTDIARLRSSFEIMDMNDRETVALIGGGHAFGQAHGITSGFEGPWTHSPTRFTNAFFTTLLDENLNWTEVTTSANLSQWESSDGLMMLKTDMSLILDPDYKTLVEEYANDEAQLINDFGAAWHKLTNRDMGNSYCVERSEETQTLLDVSVVKALIVDLLHDEAADYGHYGGLMVRLAWHCSGTFRSTDKRGGCNGARIRFPPESEWGNNKELDRAMDLLEPIHFGKNFNLSWGDLIVLAGTTALEDLGANPMPFCSGRIDELNGDKSTYLDPNIYIDPMNVEAEAFKESMTIMGFSVDEMTVLNGGGHAIGRAHINTSGFDGPWTSTPTTLDNSFFKTLIDNDWDWITLSNGKKQFVDNATQALTMLGTDMLFKTDSEFRAASDRYYADNDLFLDDFSRAWTKLMNADMFAMKCPEYESPSMVDTSSSGDTSKDVDVSALSSEEMSGAMHLDSRLAILFSFVIILMHSFR